MLMLPPVRLKGVGRRFMKGGVAVAVASLMPLAAAAASKPPARGPLNVYLVAAPPATLSKAEVAALGAKASAAGAELDRLKKDWEQQFGKKHEKWPADKLAAFLLAVEATNTPATEASCANTRPNDIEDSVVDIRDRFKGREHVALVESRDAADIVVEVVGRYGESKLKRGDKTVCFRVLAGKVKPAVLARVPVSWEEELGSSALVAHRFRTDAPFFLITATNPERWTDTANRAAFAVNELIKGNYELLKPAP